MCSSLLKFETSLFIPPHLLSICTEVTRLHLTRSTDSEHLSSFTTSVF
jgi:hypothetical protein